jgi:uncharacterized protein YjdB
MDDMLSEVMPMMVMVLMMAAFSSMIKPTASAASVVSIAITGGSASVATGGTLQLSAIATLSDGSVADVSASATWSSSDNTVASVGASGLVTGVAAGTAQITATLNGVTGTLSMTVTPAQAVTPGRTPINISWS